MADDYTQRPYRSNATPVRPQAPASNAASDPLAELARLIGQTDPFAEFGRDTARHAAPAPAAEPTPAMRAPTAPAAAPATQNFGANNYFAAAPRPAVQAPMPQARLPHAHQPHTHQPYADPAFIAAADTYRAEDAAPGHPDASAGGFEDDAYRQPLQQDDEQQEYYDDAPPTRRRMSVMAIAAVFALAVIGTAGAFGYRALFGNSEPNQPPPVIKADTTPSKIVPANPNKAPNKLIYDRVADQAQNEKLVSREEKPVDMNPVAMAAPPMQDSVQPAMAPPAPVGSGIVGNEPKKIRTIAIRPEQMGMADPQSPAAAVTPPAYAAAPTTAASAQVASNAPMGSGAAPPPRQSEARGMPPVHQAVAPAPGNAPLSLSPDAGNAAAASAARATMRTAAVPPPAQAAAAQASANGSYAVQVSSQRSEAEAQASFHGLQAKFPNQLGGRQAVIHRVELGAKGTYFRAMVGPFASANEAGALCSSLKAAGGQCLVQKN